MRTVAVVVAVGAIGCLVAAPRAARANDEDALIRHAIQLRKHGNDRAALEELQRAYGIARSPRAAAQLGFAEQALGLWPRAEVHVREALAASGDKWIRKNRETVEQALTTIRTHIGRVQIDGGQPGAQVTVNGESVGSMPLADAVSVTTGPVDIEVRAAGYAPVLKTITVGAGEYARVPFTLERVGQPGRPVPTSPPPSPAPRASSAAPAPRVTPVAVPRVAPVPSPANISPSPGPAEPPPALTETRQDVGHGRRVAGISLAAGGIAAIGCGVAASVVANHKFTAIGADAAADRPYNDSNGNWKGYETAAAVLYAVGGAATVAGVILYVTGRPSPEEGRERAASSVSLRPVLTPDRAGASVSVRF
jgi:hypothetical protein